jgi:hypothetical protein
MNLNVVLLKTRIGRTGKHTGKILLVLLPPLKSVVVEYIKEGSDFYSWRPARWYDFWRRRVK